MTFVAGPIPGLDCSPEAQAERLRQLADLQAKLNMGVSAISDRGRSETFRSAQDMALIIERLKRDIAACQLGYTGRKRLGYVDLVKGL